MSPYQQIFSTNAVLSVWRNLRNTKDNNDLLLAFQYHQDDARGQKGKKYAKGGVVESSQEVADGKAIDVGGKSIGFVVPWRAMQAQRRELKEKEKELAEALVALAGEVAFTGMYPGGVWSMIEYAHILTVHNRSLFHPAVFAHAKSAHPDPPPCRWSVPSDVEDRNTNGRQCSFRKWKEPIHRRRDSAKVPPADTNTLPTAAGTPAHDLRIAHGVERPDLHGHGRL